jgi:hypothetical protein
MNYIKIITILILLNLVAACDRRDYVTWKCQSLEQNDSSFTMILDGANLNMNSKKFLYCGSLGDYSYFDENCPNDINESKINFEQKLGILVISQKKYQCKAL